MTPTPQSLDTAAIGKVPASEEMKEQARKKHLAEVCARVRYNNPEAISTKTDQDIVDAILRALAIKPTPAGEGKSKYHCFECGTDDAAGPFCLGCNPDLKAFLEGKPAPAASPVQGVDYQDAFSVCHGALLVIGRGRQELDQVREYALEVADRIGKQVAEALIDATPQAPSTDERVKK